MKYIPLSIVWVFQYVVAVPVQIAWRVLKGFAKFGLLGFFLLSIPILGWIVLAVLVFRRTPQVERRSMLKPWGLN